MSTPDNLFDYSEKATEWIQKILAHNTEILMQHPEHLVYNKICASARYELRRRRETE